MNAQVNHVDLIPGLRRIESFSRDEMGDLCMDWTHAVYPHDDVYGQFCTLQTYVNCPPDALFAYLADMRSLEEWTWSTRDFACLDDSGLAVGRDQLADDTKIYCRVEANAQARTVDYHCAWDQGEQLWMVYLMRVIDAQVVLGKPGSVVTWTNCKHPNYDNNPAPETAPASREAWVGDFWPMFYAGHLVELQNLQRIVEHRHAKGLPISPWTDDFAATRRIDVKEL